jgi:Ran GTPase-activating protein (RanGAP) involved in mRNA processing and transport
MSEVREVAECPRLAGITSLTVRSDSRSGGTMATALAHVAKPPALRKLALPGNRLDAESVEALVFSRAADTVEELDLSDNNLGAGGATALARGRLPALRSLRLSRTRPEAGGVSALAEADFFRELRSLSLAGNIVGPNAVAALASAPAEKLRVLDLSGNRVSALGAQWLAESPLLRNLLVLDLAESRICDDGDGGAEALADSPYLDGLIHLNLAGNPIGPRAAERLRTRFGDRVSL